MTRNAEEHLEEALLTLIARVTRPLGAQSEKIMRQAELARVVRYLPTMIDVAVPEDCQSVAIPDGPAPGRALIYSDDIATGEVLVWVRDGRLIGLEQAWYTDDPPNSWPSADRVRVAR
ncbi:MAG: hypothetical protein M3Y83_12450 [Actinomycetota bacterium]|nr:hypothetical protein [Actinomycetota bacterium]